MRYRTPFLSSSPHFLTLVMYLYTLFNYDYNYYYKVRRENFKFYVLFESSNVGLSFFCNFFVFYFIFERR